MSKIIKLIFDDMEEEINKNIIIPEWWDNYKKANPDDKDDYSPLKHCCSRFWKDFCNCTKGDTKYKKYKKYKR